MEVTRVIVAPDHNHHKISRTPLDEGSAGLRHMPENTKRQNVTPPSVHAPAIPVNKRPHAS
jgi:hypothetical protein